MARQHSNDTGFRGMRSRLATALLAATAFVMLAPVAALAQEHAQPAQDVQATALERVRALVQPSIVYEEIHWSGYVWDAGMGDFLRAKPFEVAYQCTGFVVNPDGFIATAGHCLEYSTEVETAIIAEAAEWLAGILKDFTVDEVYAYGLENWFVDSSERRNSADREVYVAYGVSASGLPTGEAFPALVKGVAKFDSGDVGLLKIEADDLPTVELASEEAIEVGTEVVSVGYPASVDLVTDETFDPSFKEGSVSSKKTIGGGLLEVYETSAAMSGGMSGGPMVGLDGKVVGVNSFGPAGETQSFNFAMPASVLTDLLRDKGVENELGELDLLYRAGLTAYFNGNRALALDKFDELLEVLPSHELAQEYRGKAARLPKPAPKAEASGTMLPIVLGAIAVLGVIVALVVMRARRAHKPSGTGSIVHDEETSAGAGTLDLTKNLPVFETASVVLEESPATDPVASVTPRVLVGVGATLNGAGSSNGAAGHESPVEGASAESADPAPRFCSDCGGPLASAAKFCGHCGHVVA